MTAAEREERILSLAAQVYKLAGTWSSRLPRRVGLEDLISAAWVGAIRAIDRFDPARDTDLKVYADWKIRSAIADYLRSLDPLKRRHRQAIRRGLDSEVITFSIDPWSGPRIHRPITCPPDIPRAITSLSDTRAERVQCALEARIALRSIYRRADLDPRYARILKRYMEGDTMKEIGTAFAVHESRVSQICSRAIEKLRAAA